VLFGCDTTRIEKEDPDIELTTDILYGEEAASAFADAMRKALADPNGGVSINSEAGPSTSPEEFLKALEKGGGEALHKLHSSDNESVETNADGPRISGYTGLSRQQGPNPRNRFNLYSSTNSEAGANVSLSGNVTPGYRPYSAEGQYAVSVAFGFSVSSCTSVSANTSHLAIKRGASSQTASGATESCSKT
jgi:hypothetical protein